MDLLLCEEPSLSPSSSSLEDFEADFEDDLDLDGIRSYQDPALVQDPRVLKNVLLRRKRDRDSFSFTNYFKLQSEIKPHMRKTVTDWMLEVCEEEKCHPEVFHLAVNYTDRFLRKMNVKKSQYQLLSCACMFLASKFKETSPLMADKLVIYTDFAVTPEEIRQWELLVLSVLGWDLSVVTPYTILEQILHRVRLCDNSTSYDHKMIRRHAETFLVLAATEFEFYLSYDYPVIAASALTAAFAGFQNRNSRNTSVSDIAANLCELTGTSIESVSACVHFIEDVMSQRIAEARGDAKSSSSSSRCSQKESGGGVVTINSSAENSPSGTPTDLMDVSPALVC